jgi:hypothetical protein
LVCHSEGKTLTEGICEWSAEEDVWA